MASETVEHVALGLEGEQKLLVVLPVDIGEVRRQILQQRDCHRAAADESPRFPARLDFALDEQLPIFDFETRGLQQAAHGGVVAHVENPGHARARFAGADGLGRGAPAQQQAEGVHHQRLPAACFAGEQIEAGVKPYAQAVHHGVVFDHQFLEHA